MKTKKPYTSLLLLSALLLAACSSVPETGRRQMNLVSDAKVVEMSISAFEQMKAQMPISNHRAYNDMMTNVGHRISQQVFMDQPLAEWEFVLFDLPEVNAFAMPGGKVGVFMGLFKVVTNEEELASVVAHEIAHVTARHTHERLSQAMLLQTGGTVLGVAAAVAGPTMIGSSAAIHSGSTVMGLYNIGASGTAAAWDRDKEMEADRIGMIYMARAGYDPNAAIRVMERMAEMEYGLSQNNYGSSHPSSSERLDSLHAYLGDAMAEYERVKDFHF